MTALDEYDRLEAVGILKRSEDDPGTEVVITFGEATLTMNAVSDEGDTPLTHWSLAAIDLISENDDVAIYSLNADTFERVEVADTTLREALARVRQGPVVQGSRPRGSGRFRAALVLAAIATAGYAFLPGLLSSTARNMISPERAEILARDMMPMIEARTGPACDNPQAAAALAKLADWLNPQGDIEFKVHDLGDAEFISLPGGRVLLNQQILTDRNETILAWAALGIAGAIESPAISNLFEGGGVADSLRFLSSGALNEGAKNRAVNKMLLGKAPYNVDVAENAQQILQNAGVDGGNLEGLMKTGDLGNMEISGEELLSQDDWVNLRAVCSRP